MDIKFDSWNKVDKNEGGDGRYTIHISEKELAEQLTDDQVVFLKQALQEEWERRVIKKWTTKS